MSENIDIICKNMIVEFLILDSVSRSVKARIAGNKIQLRNSFCALNNLNVTINRGERVGLLGNNGAGKSTFLRTIAGVYPPKSGEVQVNSPTTSLFEVAVGTDKDATGYENIPLLMASRGIESAKIDEVIADVEEFTELGDALGRPLRTYSAGMRLRIAFAVATFHAEGILLMDEVIGVGDRNFAKKSRDRITKLMKEAGTLVLASHSSALLETHCERGLIFESGRIIFDGSIAEAVSKSRGK